MILAIESTFDEIGAALVEKNSIGGVRIISSSIASSAAITAKYGGAVPEILAREQASMIVPVIEECMLKAKATKEDIEAVAVTNGPGMIGSLLVGVETVKAIAYAWKKPLLRVNHMVAHVLANWIDETRIPGFPAIGLVISGGHTDLVHLAQFDKWEYLGGTRDDAVGEAFDKVARLLGLPYPGGALIQKLCDEYILDKENTKYILPRPMIHDESFDMSFSGLKTAVTDLVKTEEGNLKPKAVAYAFTMAVCEVLVEKCVRAIEATGATNFVMAGGVAANKHIREAFVAKMESLGVECFIPNLKYCTDNAPMIGAAAVLKPELADLQLRPESNLKVI